MIALSACGCAGSDGNLVAGVVENVDLDSRRVTLDHEEIPGLMKGMTMTFDVAPDVVLEGLRPGTKVGFAVKVEGGAYVVTEIRRSGS